jgi:hypothetical protein
MTLASITIPVTVLLLHEDVLCRLSVAGLDIHAQLLVKSQLLFEMAPHLREFVEPRHRWASAAWWHKSSSGSELLGAEATQTLHSCVGSWRRVVRALRVIADPGTAPVAWRLLT